MTQTLSIEGRRVSVSINKSPILNDLNFGVRPGTITGLIGPSGSGKTTLMRTIVGVQRFSGGTLSVLGLAAGDKRLRHKIGYVTQGAAVYDDLTVFQNLKYFAVLTKSNKIQVEEVIAKVQLQKQRNQIVSSLSGGQRARVSLAIALLGDPDLLVLDEPTVGLDPILRQELWDLFDKLAAAGKSLLVSSHVMDEADRCDELLLLRDGRLLWNDSRDQLLRATRTNSVGEAFVKAILAKGRV
ncbi:MAG TPA: ABC transporter ATP-binding protein [Candidatus Saccharibacteria bacterium]|nr:ABC transporter ATP-binding protein [Candidatus Saccharibacteria bacterium]HRQ98201.1 ABC transporter ATP-binding protein [Candidatus Saccharibacteria bacterium]